MTYAERLIKRPTVLAALVGVIVLTLVWWLGWMSPEGAKLTSVRASVVQATATESNLSIQLKELEQDQHQEKITASYLKRFGAAVPSRPDAPGLVVEVYNLAKHDGVALSSITDNSEVPNLGYSAIPVSIEVTGGHDAVLSFVNGMYHLTRLVTIQSLSLSGAGDVDQPSSTATTVSISATAYTLDVPKTAGTQG